MRTLPAVKTARLDLLPRPLSNGEVDGGAEAFRPEDFPLIEGIASLDSRREQLEAFRSFSRDQDLWIEDHQPLLFVKHPLVSAVMFLETFMEAARLLYPHLQVRGVRQVRFMDMIQCPSRSRSALQDLLPSGRCQSSGGAVQVSLAAREISPAGRLTDRFSPHCEGQVILGGGDDGEGCLGAGFLDFPIRPDEL